jgi:hypothetical protein
MSSNALRKQDLAAIAQAASNDQLKSSTRYLLKAIVTGTEPQHAAKVDFGLDTERHFEALQYSVLGGKITPEMLDASIGNGQALTALVRTDKDNPHRDVVFEMRWHDLLRNRVPAERTAKLEREMELEM